jgi:threonylcarbamoyladenosine tRNA methylthiotransferase MtaB
MRVFFQALGCRLNEAELETWSNECRQHGYTLADDVEAADLVVINSCAVTEESVRKSRQMVRRARRQNPAAKLVLSGCYASLGSGDGGDAGFAELGVDLVVPNQAKDRLIEIARRELDLPVMPQAGTEPAEQLLFRRGRQRAFIKVQDGCRYRCAFCIVTRARGDERSRTLADIIDEINRVHAAGVNEVVLAGVHLGGYGSDQGTDLASLIEQVLARTDVPRLRLGSLEPWELQEDFWSLFANPRLMPHLHLPIQSGADSVLRRMARRCRTVEFRQLVERARQAVPEFNVTTDVIVGFPGETDAEWDQTVEFVDAMDFGHVHIFAYSPRSGTKAAGMPDQIHRDLKRARSQQLHDIASRGSQRVMQRMLGQRCEVLFEHRAPDDESQTAWLGYTPNYLRVEVDNSAGEDLENQILGVELHGLAEGQARLRGVSIS